MTGQPAWRALMRSAAATIGASAVLLFLMGALVGVALLFALDRLRLS